MGSSASNNQIAQQSGGQITPVTPQNAQQVGQQAVTQAQQGDPMGIYKYPLETVLGMGMNSTPASPDMLGQQPLSAAPQQPQQSAPAQPQQDPNAGYFASYANPPTSNVSLAQYINPDGTAAPLAGQPGFDSSYTPAATAAPNNFNGSINGIPYQNGMLGQMPP